MNTFYEHHENSIRFGYTHKTREHLRPEGHAAIPRQTRNGDRRSRPPPSGHPELLPRRLDQTVRPRSPAPHRGHLNNVRDFGVPKGIEAATHLRQAMAAVTDRYQAVQQDILETFVDRGQLRQLAASTHLPTGRRVPGLKLDHPRQLALMHALVRFAHIAAGDTFTTRDLHAPATAALDATTEQYRLASLRYDLSTLRAKGLVERVRHTRRYRLLPQGYTICLVFLKLFDASMHP